MGNLWLRVHPTDAIAMKLGIEKTAMIRLRAGISYVFTEAADEGHFGLPTNKLIPLAEELLEAPTPGRQ
jgi:exodeoxyribonuclease V alpha subunit